MGTEDATSWIGGASAVGTAAFGIVEVLKGTRLGEVGAEHILDSLGPPGRKAFESFYGKDYEAVLRASYRSSGTQLADQVKDALRVALNKPGVADEMSKFLEQYDDTLPLSEVVAALQKNAAADPKTPGDKLSAEDLVRFNARLASYTMAVDARVSAACAAASAQYETTMKVAASVIAIGLSVGTYYLVDLPNVTLAQAALLGVLAVPIAPIARDVTSIIQTASEVFARRSSGRPPS